ncbi:hypothetical protein GCM10027445_30440 [Amycolatopsis endophytica]|uniref:Uncharacterized protein n=1 Tax=Amycolatopsis endophytica TaxID=860233 RepID=A0A853BA54_9PSEU|nr:hypothetical protein [Amycolatopsis endophytica]NYI91860.1 hypothetical protein [Amycolatopsis endophytica]
MNEANQLFISVLELRALCDRLLKHLSELEGEGVQVERDYFWSIPDEDLYDVYSEPETFTVGQVSESIGHLRALLADESIQPTRHIVWLADVLRAIGTPAARRAIE